MQYLGQRPTVTDGGHFNGFWDHLIGRYVLTTPYPETALSFMKAQNVSYLLIDQTDLGKYGAYSKIGGDNNNDRFSSLPLITSDPSKIQETSKGIIRLYEGGWGVDQDILYKNNKSEIFLPGPIYDKIGNPKYSSYIGGVLLETTKDKNITKIEQPTGIFIYQGKQIKIPMRYAYYKGKVLDFKSGINALFFIMPRVYQSKQGIKIDETGSGIYLSPKVLKSLFAQLYLLNDSFNEYPSVKIAHIEPNPFVYSLNKQGISLGNFLDYHGFRGPIKIWKIEENNSIIARPEFLRPKGTYAEFDNLTFIR